MEERFSAGINDAFGERILSFDMSAANLYGEISAKRERSGLAIDGYHRATIATRNTRDFEGCGIKIINPWEFSAEKRL